MDLINKIKVDLHYEKYFDAREIIGCTDEEIIELEKMHPNGIHLPSTYKEFLKFSGKRFSYFRPTSDFYYQDLILLWKDNYFNKFFDKFFFDKRYFTQSDQNVLFPEDGFIFSIHLGYQFRFFRCDGSSDPIVYYFDDKPDRKDFLNNNLTLSELLFNYIKEFIDEHKRVISKNKSLNNKINEFKMHLFNFLDFCSTYKGKDPNVNIDEIIGSYKRVLIDIYSLFTDQNTSDISGYLQDYFLLKYSDRMDKELYTQFRGKADELYMFYKREVVPLV